MEINTLSQDKIRDLNSLDSKLEELKSAIKKKNPQDPILKIDFSKPVEVQKEVVSYMGGKANNSEAAYKKLEEEAKVNTRKEPALHRMKDEIPKYKLDKSKALYFYQVCLRKNL